MARTFEELTIPTGDYSATPYVAAFTKLPKNRSRSRKIVGVTLRLTGTAAAAKLVLFQSTTDGLTGSSGSINSIAAEGAVMANGSVAVSTDPIPEIVTGADKTIELDRTKNLYFYILAGDANLTTSKVRIEIDG